MGSWLSIFAEAGLEIDAKGFPAQQEEAGARGGVCAGESRAQNGRREKQRDEAGFEEHAVRLVAGEIARRGDEGKEAHERDEQRRARPNVEDDENRRDQADPRDQHEGAVARAEPEEAGRVPPFVSVNGRRDGLQKVAGWKDAGGTEQSLDLENQGIECGEVDQAERAQENPARQRWPGDFPDGISGPRSQGTALFSQVSIARDYTEKRTGEPEVSGVPGLKPRLVDVLCREARREESGVVNSKFPTESKAAGLEARRYIRKRPAGRWSGRIGIAEAKSRTAKRASPTKSGGYEPPHSGVSRGSDRETSFTRRARGWIRGVGDLRKDGAAGTDVQALAAFGEIYEKFLDVEAEAVFRMRELGGFVPANVFAAGQQQARLLRIGEIGATTSVRIWWWSAASRRWKITSTRS